MKFSQIWKEEIKKLPSELSKKSINYKKWKKICNEKKLNEEEIIKLLQLDIIEIENIFLENINKENNSFCCCFIKKKIYDDQTIYNFVSLNTKCLYKIIKKLDKKLNIHIRAWYNEEINKYKFYNSYQIKRIEINLFGYNEECPICLEIPKQIFILNCGHCICITCFENIYKITNINGPIKNRINYSLYRNIYKYCPKCPLCRRTAPFRIASESQILCIKNNKLNK
jgi:hypothetical protein